MGYRRVKRLILLGIVLLRGTHLGTVAQNRVDQTIFDRFLTAHEIVTFQVFLDGFDLLIGVFRHNFVQAALELQRIDEFGRDASQREWTRQCVLVDEYDSDGDLMPGGTLSSSSSESGSDDYD